MIYRISVTYPTPRGGPYAHALCFRAAAACDVAAPGRGAHALHRIRRRRAARVVLWPPSAPCASRSTIVGTVMRETEEGKAATSRHAAAGGGRSMHPTRRVTLTPSSRDPSQDRTTGRGLTPTGHGRRA